MLSSPSNTVGKQAWSVVVGVGRAVCRCGLVGRCGMLGIKGIVRGGR